MRFIILFLLAEYILTNIEGFIVLIPIGDFNVLTYYYYLPAMYGEYLELTLHINHILYVLILSYVLEKLIPKTFLLKPNAIQSF